MADQRRGGIAWTDETLNPIRARHRVTGKVGWYCQRVSDGCKNCYAATMNEWRGNGVDYTVPALKDVELFLDEEMLTAPLRWHRPRHVFLCSMTDLFADFIPDEWIDRIVEVMARAGDATDPGRQSPHYLGLRCHVFQVLTKRPERMRDYLARKVFRVRGGEHDGKIMPFLPHVWWGVSVEDQATADARIPLLLQTPAAVRWVSYEPGLAGVDFDGDDYSWRGWLRGWHCELSHASGCDGSCSAGRCPEPTQVQNERLNWLVVGGESGPGARPFDLAWVRSAITQCRAAGVKTFFKQAGSHPILDGVALKLKDRKGGDLCELSAEFHIREYPNDSR